MVGYWWRFVSLSQDFLQQTRHKQYYMSCCYGNQIMFDHGLWMKIHQQVLIDVNCLSPLIVVTLYYYLFIALICKHWVWE